MSMKWHVTMKCRTLPSLCCMAAGLSPAWPVKKKFHFKILLLKKKIKIKIYFMTFCFLVYLLKFYFIARVMWIAYLQGRGCWRWRPAPMTGCTGRRPCPLRALFEWPTSWASSLPSPSGCWCLRVVNRNWWSGQKVGSRLANTLPLCYIFNGEKYFFLPSTDLHTNTISWLTAEGEFIEIPSHRREATNFRAATMAKVALNQQLSASKSAARAAPNEDDGRCVEMLKRAQTMGARIAAIVNRQRTAAGAGHFYWSWMSMSETIWRLGKWPGRRF